MGSIAEEVSVSEVEYALISGLMLCASRHGFTVAYLAKRFNESKQEIRRMLALARRSAPVPVIWIDTPLIDPECDHSHLYGPGLRLCGRCLASNHPNHPAFHCRLEDMPAPEPSKVYLPGALLGGI